MNEQLVSISIGGIDVDLLCHECVRGKHGKLYHCSIQPPDIILTVSLNQWTSPVAAKTSTYAVSNAMIAVADPVGYNHQHWTPPMFALEFAWPVGNRSTGIVPKDGDIFSP